MEISVIPLINLPRNKNQIFIYSVPFCLEKQVKIGQLIEIPFRKRKLKGIITEINTKKIDKKISLKKINKIENQNPILSEKQLELCYWLKDYYLVSLGLVLKTALSY